jgi:hypothetical protein
MHRGTVLRLGVPAALGVVGVRAALAEPIDGKGNDVCPCFVDISGARLAGDETIVVSGPCWVATPPETLTVRVHVRGARDARAVGASTGACEGREGDPDHFSVAATSRGRKQFAAGDDVVVVDATAHIRPEDDPDIVARWQWAGALR